MPGGSRLTHAGSRAPEGARCTHSGPGRPLRGLEPLDPGDRLLLAGPSRRRLDTISEIADRRPEGSAGRPSARRARCRGARPRVAGVPSATIRPSAITATRSASSWASSTQWVVRRTVVPQGPAGFTARQRCPATSARSARAGRARWPSHPGPDRARRPVPSRGPESPPGAWWWSSCPLRCGRAARRSPRGSTVKLTPRTAHTVPYRWCRPCVTTASAMGVSRCPACWCHTRTQRISNLRSRCRPAMPRDAVTPNSVRWTRVVARTMKASASTSQCTIERLAGRETPQTVRVPAIVVAPTRSEAK